MYAVSEKQVYLLPQNNSTHCRSCECNISRDVCLLFPFSKNLLITFKSPYTGSEG